MRKSAIEADHKLAATELDIVLLAEDEFDIYASAMSPKWDIAIGICADIAVWEEVFSIQQRFPKMESLFRFMRSEFWMQRDMAVSSRRVIASLRNVRGELDPEKREHQCIACDIAALFSHSLARMCNYIFKAYLHPKNQLDLDEAIKMIIYGGRESYAHRNQLYRLVKRQVGSDASDDELSLPEWERFIKLVRQLLDAPVDVARVPLILREVGFGRISGAEKGEFARVLCQEAPQAARFSILIIGYLFRAGGLPDDFRRSVETEIIGLIGG